MVVKVASKLRQVALLRAFVSSNIVGDSMLVRLRSTTIGLLGLVAAVGLGLVAFVSLQGWPEVFSGPLPKPPPALVRNDPIGMPPPERHAPHHATGRSRVALASSKRALPVIEPVAPQEAETAPAPVAVEPPEPVGHGHPGHHSQPQESPAPTVVAQVPSQEPTAEDSAVPPPGSPQAPGHSGEAPGHSGGESPGHSGESPGHSGQAPGHSGEAPGHSGGESPGHSGESPGHSGESHGGHH
jgi:hypothetical protein